MKFWSALFFTTFFLAGVERLQAPDEIKEAPSLADESKLEFWESQTLITKTVESKLSTDHSSTSTPSIIVSLSSSTLEQEQLVTPTEAPATPSYDIDSSLPFTNTASSSESLAQASRDVLSSVIFIPPSNPVQVQSPQESRDLGVDKENSASDTVHPTKEPEILSTALNSTPPTPISSEVTPVAPSTSTKKEEEDSITAALKQADEESTTKEEDMPSFDEFKRRVLQEEEEKSKQQNAESASGAVQKPKKVKERKQSNYASVDCGAKILEHNKEASNPESILVENKDLYMLNPCSAQVWFVVELCDVAHVKSIQIANFELFSSTPESFRVYVSKRYPTREWTMLGTFQAREEREVQTFPLDEPMYAKYFKVEMLSHFGSEHYCPLSLLRVYGSSMMEELEDHEIEGNEDNYNPDGDNEVPVLPPQPGANVDNKEPNLLERAADTVISLVKKFTGNGSDKENGTEVQEVANNESDVRESSSTEASGQNGSQDLSKGKLVTLVGHEDLNENTEEVAGEKKDHSNKRNESQDKSAAVNVSDKHRSLCKVVDAQDESTKTCLALTSREMFAHVIGRYCLGRCKRRLHFSESAVEAAAKGRFKNIENCDNCDPNKNANDDETGVENRESKSKVTEPPHEEAVHKKASDVENLDEESRTSSEATNLKVSVKIPEPSSSDVELKRESTILRPVESSETYTPSSRTVQPSQALDTSNKNEISDDKTPALEDTSLVTSMPSNSTQAASISQMLQSSELPKFTESHVDVLEGKPIPDAKKGNNEQQQSFPNSQTSVLEQELVESTRKSAQQSKVPSETKGDTSEGREEGVSKASDLEGKEKMEEHKSSVSSPEISAPNSIHVLSQSSPDIDVLETKLTDKDGREGTAQLPEELHVKDEKDPLENVEGTSPSKVVVGSSNVHVDSEQGTSKETTSSMSETEAFSREKVVSSSTVIQSQSVDSAIHPTSPPSVDTPDSPESVVPLPAPPVISPPPPVTADTSTSTLEVTSDPSDSSLDAAMLSKAQHSSSTSSSMASMAGSAGLHKESIFVRLSNKIKALEQNLNMSTLYMEQLNQRYRKSLDELQRNSDKKVALLTNATKKAEALMNSQKEQISHLQAQLDNLTNAMADMAARMGRLKKEVVERHVIGLCIELIAILVLFVVFARRRNTQERSSTLQRPGYYMNGHGPPTLAIEDSNHNKNKEIDPTILSGKEELLRSFGNTPTAETIGAITVTDSLDNITKEDSFNPNESKKRRNRKSKASNNHKPSLDSSCGDTSNKEPSPDSDRAPSPASLVSRTAGLLFFGARGFFGGFQIPWSQKKPRTVRSDPNITARSVINQGDTASVKPKKTGITRAKSLELIPEEPTLNRHVPAPTSPLPTEIGVMFKRPPDCYYSKKGIVKNVSTNPFKFGKYGVLDTQMA